MLPPELRLRRTEDFDRVRQQGRTWRHPLLTMGVCPNQLEHNRFGFVISKRFGTAVARNRARRRLREAVRISVPDLKAGFDIVLIPRNEISDQPYKEVIAALQQLFQRAHLLIVDEKKSAE